jgi:hypothetical protein
LDNEVYPMHWRWRARLPERFGQACRVTARGALNSVRVEFEDGFTVITSRWAVRRGNRSEASEDRKRVLAARRLLDGIAQRHPALALNMRLVRADLNVAARSLAKGNNPNG